MKLYLTIFKNLTMGYRRLNLALLLIFSFELLFGQNIKQINFGLLSPKDILFNTELLDTFWFSSPYPLSAYTPEEIDIQHNIHKQMNTTFAYTYSPFDDAEIYTNKNDEIPIELRNIDNEPITPYTWKVIQIKLVEPDSSILIATLKRPNWWIKHYKADKVGNRFNIFISDMNVAGEAEVLKIQGQQIDTRIETHKAEGNYKFRPVTGKFERTSSDVWTYYFENGDTIGCTPNHPYYSQDRLEYVPIGEINIGENIKLAGEKFTKLVSKVKHNKGSETVYNLEIYRDHNFYVGNQGLLVHNSCLIGEIIEQSANWFKYKNFKGLILKIDKQTSGGIATAINTAENLPNIPTNAGKKLEAIVARTVQQKKEIKGYGVKVQRANGNPAGDMDIITDHELIEVKKSLSDVKIDQIAKYANIENDDFMNLNAKKVILYIEDAAANPSHPTLQAIQAMNMTHGIEVKIIIGSLTDLKNALK